MDDVGKGHLFVISGPSGTGKGSICAGLTGKPGVALSVSMTTREPRKNEVDGENYYFVEKEMFQKTIKENGFYEYAEIFGEYYGTPKAPVREMIDSGLNVILEIDVDGAMQIKEKVPEVILVFILPPSPEELRRRMENRGTETSERIEKRLKRADIEIAQIDKYDYCVINDKLEKATEDMYAIIQSERLRDYSQAGTRKTGKLSDMPAISRAARLRIEEGSAEALINRYKKGRAN